MAVEDHHGRQATLTEPRKIDLPTTISTKADELLERFGGPTPNELLAAHGAIILNNSVGIELTDRRTGGRFIVRLFQKLVPGSRALFIEYPYMKDQPEKKTTPSQLFYAFDLDQTSWGVSIEDQKSLNKRNRKQAAEYLRAIEETLVREQREYDLETMRLGHQARGKKSTS